MTKKCLCLVLCLVFVGLAAAGCANAQGTQKEVLQEETDNMEKQLTLDYLISHSDLTAADFENVDFDAFVAMYDLTQENFKEYYLPDLIEMYHREMARERTVDYSDIFTQAQGQIREEDFEQIDVLIVEYHEGTSNHYLVLDFGEGKAFGSSNDIVSACGESSKTAELSADDKQFVLDALRDSGITGWQNEYIGSSENTTGHLSWAVGIRLRSGASVCYHGHGVTDSGTPVALFTLQESLARHFDK